MCLRSASAQKNGASLLAGARYPSDFQANLNFEVCRQVADSQAKLKTALCYRNWTCASLSRAAPCTRWP